MQVEGQEVKPQMQIVRPTQVIFFQFIPEGMVNDKNELYSIPC